MFRTIVTLALIVVLVISCWVLYKRINGPGTLGAGNVYVTNPSDSKDSGDSSLLGGKPLEEAHPTPSRSDDPGTINTEPVATYNNAADNTVIPPVKPQLAANQPFGQPYNQQQAYGPLTPSPQDSSRPSYGQEKVLPAGDTFSPNPPNGMAFTGTGKFEVYRQGDLTFRVNTSTGESCVLYATMEEWNKPVVYSHGCGSRGGRWKLHK